MKSFFAVSSLAAVATATTVNPIRKVVTLLQDMKKEIEDEGDKEKDLYEKFMCFCKGNTDGLSKAAEEAASLIEELRAKQKADKAEKDQLQHDLVQHKQDRNQAKADLATASKIREKEHEAYVEASGDTKKNIDSLNGAIPALEKGMGVTGFLQSPAAVSLKRVITNFGDLAAPSKNLRNGDRTRAQLHEQGFSLGDLLAEGNVKVNSDEAIARGFKKHELLEAGRPEEEVCQAARQCLGEGVEVLDGSGFIMKTVTREEVLSAGFTANEMLAGDSIAIHFAILAGFKKNELLQAGRTEEDLREGVQNCLQGVEVKTTVGIGTNGWNTETRSRTREELLVAGFIEADLAPRV